MVQMTSWRSRGRTTDGRSTTCLHWRPPLRCQCQRWRHGSTWAHSVPRMKACISVSPATYSEPSSVAPQRCSSHVSIIFVPYGLSATILLYSFSPGYQCSYISTCLFCLISVRLSVMWIYRPVVVEMNMSLDFPW